MKCETAYLAGQAHTLASPDYSCCSSSSAGWDARAVRDGRVLGWMTLGAFLGPFLGVGLYLRAMQLANIGVVATITALLPVVVIPLSMAIHREQVSPRAFGGAVLAFLGVWLMFNC